MDEKRVYPLKFNKWIYLLVPVVLLLTIPVVVMSVINIVKMSGTEGYYMVFDIVVIALSLAILVISLSAIFFAHYSIKKNCLYCTLGIFYNRVPISAICGITHFTHIDKLMVYFKSGNLIKQIVVNIDPQLYDDFIDAVRGINRNIPFDADSDDYDTK